MLRLLDRTHCRFHKGHPGILDLSSDLGAWPRLFIQSELWSNGPKAVCLRMMLMASRQQQPIATIPFAVAFTATYRDSVRFLRAFPLLALVPAALELLQHVVEVRLGMYASLAAFKSAGHDTLRLAFGFLKELAMVILGYWIVRFVASGSVAYAKKADRPAMRLFGWFVAFVAIDTAIELFALPSTGVLAVVAFVGSQTIGCLIAAWSIAAPLGNGDVGLRASIVIMVRQLPWTYVFTLVTILPLMVPHYLFAVLAILAPKISLWPTLLVDALLVSWITAVAAIADFYAARRATDLVGVTLVPGL